MGHGSIPVVLVTMGCGKKLVVICFRDMELKRLKMYPVFNFSLSLFGTVFVGGRVHVGTKRGGA